MKLMRVDSLIEQGKAPSPLGLTRSYTYLISSSFSFTILEQGKAQSPIYWITYFFLNSNLGKLMNLYLFLLSPISSCWSLLFFPFSWCNSVNWITTDWTFFKHWVKLVKAERNRNPSLSWTYTYPLSGFFSSPIEEGRPSSLLWTRCNSSDLLVCLLFAILSLTYYLTYSLTSSRLTI